VGGQCFGNPSTSVTTGGVYFGRNSNYNGIYNSSPISSGLAIRCSFSSEGFTTDLDYIGIILNSDTDFVNRPNSYYFDLFPYSTPAANINWHLKIIKRTNGVDTTLSETNYTLYDALTPNVIEARRFGSKLGMYGAYPPYPSEGSPPYPILCTASDTWYPMPYFGFQETNNSVSGTLNYILVRKYVEPEPTVSVGPEQTYY
jgi:hypothetical protein